jgi:hypothetical protein
MHPVKGTIAQRIHDGGFAGSALEERVGDIWGSLALHMSTDWYDNSLEVYFDAVTPIFGATQEQAEKIFEMGFCQFWLNFLDGTEQHSWRSKEGAITIGARKAAGYQKWTEERAAQYR